MARWPCSRGATPTVSPVPHSKRPLRCWRPDKAWRWPPMAPSAPPALCCPHPIPPACPPRWAMQACWPSTCRWPQAPHAIWRRWRKTPPSPRCCATAASPMAACAGRRWTMAATTWPCGRWTMRALRACRPCSRSPSKPARSHRCTSTLRLARWCPAARPICAARKSPTCAGTAQDPRGHGHPHGCGLAGVHQQRHTRGPALSGAWSLLSPAVPFAPARCFRGTC